MARLDGRGFSTHEPNATSVSPNPSRGPAETTRCNRQEFNEPL